MWDVYLETNKMKDKYYHRAVMVLAFKDITEYLKSQNISCPRNGDIWAVTPYYMNNKKTRRLNAELGLGGINKSKP